jgi:hypothetical protein
MAQLTKSLCEEIIRTEGKCGYTQHEILQMAHLALRALDQQGVSVSIREVANKTTCIGLMQIENNALDQQGGAVAHRHLHEDGWEYYDALIREDCKDCQKLYTLPQADPKLAERLLREVMQWHSDPDSSDYNLCDKSPCQWCEDAAAALGGGK